MINLCCSGKVKAYFLVLCQCFARNYDIGFQRIILKEIADPNGSHPKYKSVINSINNNLKTNNHIRNLWYYYRTFYVSSIFSESFKNHKYNILFLKDPAFVKDIIKETSKKGCEVYCKRDNDILKQPFPYHKVVGCINSNITSDPRYDDNFLKELEQADIIPWVNSYCEVNINTILLPKLGYFINSFCPRVIFLIDKYIAFYNDNQIDMVFTQHMVSVDEYAAIAAARYSKKTKSACLQHGDEAFAVKMWDYSEYRPYDIYFTTNDEREEYIKHSIQFGNFDTKVFQYPNRFRILPKVKRPKKKCGSPSPAGPKILVYVPITYPRNVTL